MAVLLNNDGKSKPKNSWNCWQFWQKLGYLRPHRWNPCMDLVTWRMIFWAATEHQTNGQAVTIFICVWSIECQYHHRKSGVTKSTHGFHWCRPSFQVIFIFYQILPLFVAANFFWSLGRGRCTGGAWTVLLARSTEWAEFQGRSQWASPCLPSHPINFSSFSLELQHVGLSSHLASFQISACTPVTWAYAWGR